MKGSEIMANIILGTIAATFALLMLLLLGLMIAADVKESKRYKNAFRTEGIIHEKYGTKTVDFYGRRQRRKYGHYFVRFQTPYGVYGKEVLLRNHKLQCEDKTEVRYVIEDGKIELVDDISYRKIKELTIAFLIAIPYCLALWYCKEKGMF